MVTIGTAMLLFATSLLSTPLRSADDPAGLTPDSLRCESLTDPLGVGEKVPRLSWVIRSGERGQRQTAYQILVSSEDESLAADKGDLWDSGKVDSAETFGVAYAGRPLASHAKCVWKVRVWDKDGRTTGWSKPTRWTMGVLDPAEWKAQWVGHDAGRRVPLPDADFAPAKWIGFAGDKPLEAPKGFRVYLTTFALPADAKVEKAELLVTGDDKAWFVLNGEQVAMTVGYDHPKQVDVTAHVKPGDNTVRAQVENGAAGPMGLLAKLTIRTTGGRETVVATDKSWRCTDDGGANWHNRPIAADAWPAARVVRDYGDQPWSRLKYSPLVLPPATYLRTDFKADRPVRRATVYATALGIFDLYLNGRRVTDDRFNPGWTDYAKRVYYRAYDVTDRVRQGGNALGAVLADGWYSGYVGYGRNRDLYGKAPRFAAQLHVEYEDGTTADVLTGPDWKAAVGAVREADFLMGETYDARREVDGWSDAGFDDAKWETVDVGAEVKPVVQWHPGPPVRKVAEFKAAKVAEPKPGVYVLDMGQNFAGVPRLTVTGDAGQTITLRFAERLNPDGTVYTTNLRDARATDTYICRGGGKPETWEPRFTFHGFQYVEVTGLRAPPTPETVVGVAISSDTPVAGAFECSDPMLNRLYRNIVWTQRMNFIDIPTDCPQRDERLGWTGDAQVYAHTATLNADVQAFFTKWLVDLADAQRADGQFPQVAPLKVAGDDGGPAWADAGVIVPWTLYETYGDKRLLERHYDGMTRFIAFCEKRSTPDGLPPAAYHCFGDWLSINADTPNDVIYTAYFARSALLTARAAGELGKADDVRRYHELFDRLKAGFNKAYVAPDGRIKGDTQACYVLALAFDLVDGDKRDAAAKYLVEDVEKRGWHLSTGFIGTKELMLVLAKIGRNDVAYRLIHQDTFPSWGFSIRHRATSIWERWDGWTPDKGFQDPGMNSFAHYSFGAVYQWMFENIGGILPGGRAYQDVAIVPELDGKLTWAKTRYDSVRGRIETSWKREGDQFTLDVTIPPNVTAAVHVPSKEGTLLTGDGQAPADSDDVTPWPGGRRNGRVVFNVKSGTYHFGSTVDTPK